MSGFDALSVLARVMFRVSCLTAHIVEWTQISLVVLQPSPQIQLGPIDLATAFCVVDARRTNLPIIYASESFTELTGYPNAEIIGKNCRFLQSPDGNVQQGSPRLFTDSNGVFHLRKHINSVRETQVSIVNYRKDRSPFINLISIIPITWDSDEVAYFVGFQLDLSKQPEKILQRVREGNYTVNLSVLPGAPPIEPVRAIMPPADSEQSSSSESPGSMSTGYNVEQTIIDNVRTITSQRITVNFSLCSCLIWSSLSV